YVMTDEPKSINPYAVSQDPPLGEDTYDRMSFRGVLNEDDYASLLPRRDFPAVLYGTLITLMSAFGLVLIPAIIYRWVRQGFDPAMIGVAVIAALMLGGVIFFLWFRKRSSQARRLLKKHPDLLGPVQGRVTALGIAVHDGTRHHWFGPQQLINSHATSEGMRICLSHDPTRFLPLSKRIFDGYSEQVASRFVRQWKEDSKHAASESLLGLDFWHELNPIPEAAVPFAGTLSVQLPLRTAENRNQASVELFTAVLAILAGAFAIGFWIVKLLIVCYGVFQLAVSARSWYRYFYGIQTDTWNQSGWIGSDELAIQQRAAGVRIAFTEFKQVIDNQQVVSLMTPAAAFHFAADQFENEATWTEVRERLLTLGDQSTTQESAA
ncbi:MAG: hypothetical protein AAFU85_29540, partial [Planctomycetota bacterium]